MGLIRWTRNECREARDAARELWHFTRTHNWRKTARRSVQRKYWIWWIVGAIMTGCLVALAIYRDAIVKWFEPHKDDIVNTPASWVVPIGVLFILSFPPLGGQEVVLLVIGLIWGLWIGFAIACAGTFLGEMACYVLFRYFFSEKAAKIERQSMFYACIARLMREGGLWIVIVVRFSAVPGHVVTAIQSTVGMGIWWYAIAVIASLPKQLAIVYLGVIFGETDATADPANQKKQERISLAVLFITALMTVWALYIVYMRCRLMYAQILAEKDRQEEELGGDVGSGGRKSSVGFLDDGGVRVSFERRDTLAEAFMEGDPGPFIGPKAFEERMRGGATGPLAASEEGEDGYAARCASAVDFDPRAASGGNLDGSSAGVHTAIEMKDAGNSSRSNVIAAAAPTQAGGGSWQDGRPRAAAAAAAAVYGERYGAEGVMPESFTHLPLEGSEHDPAGGRRR